MFTWLVQESANNCADINGTKGLMGEGTTKLIWQYLGESKGIGTFFYEKRQGSPSANHGYQNYRHELVPSRDCHRR
ncbi:hypothetical protein HYALB_00009438 [Hymenoscyphus albidus]|uniref:Uncharacterized protein n=1 Tax=Hymenoscyphus albidus TaxID=595503 RepID=A0A9N9LM78_9HELO|nr:hypothetical protein HYALB_00009438 [Hymenoscyphus albidus]